MIDNVPVNSAYHIYIYTHTHTHSSDWFKETVAGNPLFNGKKHWFLLGFPLVTNHRYIKIHILICIYIYIRICVYTYIFIYNLLICTQCIDTLMRFPVKLSPPWPWPPFSAALRVQRRARQIRQIRGQQLGDIAPAGAQREVPGLGKAPRGSPRRIDDMFLYLMYNICIYNMRYMYMYVYME